MSEIGTTVFRKDARAKVTGEALYATDLFEEGMLHGAVVRSPVPHARILSIDAGPALALPGVFAVLTSKDVPGKNEFGVITRDQPVLCNDTVRFTGDAVALVAAETREQAYQGAREVRVAYDPLPSVFDVESALREHAPLVHEKGNILKHVHLEKGNVESGFPEADIVLSETFRTAPGEHMPLETEAGLAKVSQDGVITIWASTQSAYRDQRDLAHALGLPENRIRVIVPHVGGAFGRKDGITVQIYLALLARATGRPVKMHCPREESASFFPKRHGTLLKYKVGAKRDGTLVAAALEAYYDTGAYAVFGEKVMGAGVEYGLGGYRIPHTQINGYSVYTNNPPAGAFRGFGMPQVTFAWESLLDELAYRCGMDPLEFRLKNSADHGEEGPLGQIFETSTGLRQTLEGVRSSPLWKKRLDLKTVSDPFKARGVGVASCIKGCGLGIGMPDFAEAEVQILPEGTFVARVGVTDMGEGIATTFCQIVAELLGVSSESVECIQSDTFLNPPGGPTAASRNTILTGKACFLAAEDLKRVLCETAARHWGGAPEGVVLTKSGPRMEGRTASFSEVSSWMVEQGKPPGVRARYDMPVASRPLGYGLPHRIYSFASHAALVEVDRLTGQVTVLEVSAFLDCGNVLNPQGLEGQSEGGVAQGIGFALMEKNVIQEGSVLNNKLSTYIIPTAPDMPAVETSAVDTYEEAGPFGAKGIAEAASGSVAPAIFNAVRDAVGVRLRDLPLSPEQLVEAMMERHES
ncbi:MAG: xanthine dehydrogenase family protein molybdopterin-binding subunit [Armatimonadetes bacterium]|nr:xanthine dehydrogenase family protein molybdopterin-binding subunit [Armatimonadota bacterium]